jgi:hypothetical protein
MGIRRRSQPTNRQFRLPDQRSFSCPVFISGYVIEEQLREVDEGAIHKILLFALQNCT